MKGSISLNGNGGSSSLRVDFVMMLDSSSRCVSKSSLFSFVSSRIVPNLAPYNNNPLSLISLESLFNVCDDEVTECGSLNSSIGYRSVG